MHTILTPYIISINITNTYEKKFEIILAGIAFF